MGFAAADSIYSFLHPSSSSHLSSSHLEKNQFFLAHGQSAAAVKLLSQAGQEELIISGTRAVLDEEDMGSGLELTLQGIPF